MPRSEQLLLNLRPRPDARLSDFAAPAYEELLLATHRLLAEPGGLLYIYGQPGQGRSHLLAALCGEGERLGLSTVLLPLAELCHEDAALLSGLEEQGLIAFDDIGAIAGNAAWEEALFHLFNRARAGAATRLVFSATYLPAQCGFGLPDLVSRLALAPAWLLALPDDDSRQALLEEAARRRDLDMEEGVMRYLVNRGPREPGRLLAMVALLDRQSLMAGRRLTIPFVRQVLDSPEALANGFSV
ncbi:MAG: regulatory inactivation of DnaA Hda protein [Moraxellaceae bacterium]|jgi:DnaA family protein|nr:regulatory inactivation of DnaA Hda protein [Moraxellaceae bacterium]